MNRIFKRTVSMLVCVLMLLGSMTFVAAAEKSVDASMSWSDSFDGTYKDITDDHESIFNIEGFEPGESVIRYLKLENNGNRAFSYALEFASENTPGELASVIDVYAAVATAEADIASMTKIGTLAEVINGNALSTGKILPEGLTGEGFSTGVTVVAVGLKMKEDAADKYQGASVGAFDIKLTATEDKAFGDYPDKFAIKFENTDKYLYRVGNGNPVALGSLFTALPDVKVGNVNVTVEKLDSVADVAYTYTPNADWTKGTIQFTGTGPVKVTITDDGKNNTTPISLNLEVVNAYNVTTYSELKNRNSVLLDDITMSSNGAFYLSNATLYGNGFTFDVTNGAYIGTGSVSNNYVVGLADAKLDNIRLVGAVYTDYGATTDKPYNRPVVLSSGSSAVLNSYISNCASPVRVKDGSIEIVNTTLKGGNFANLDIRNGKVILDNVTTINQVDGNDTASDGTVVVGLGVVVFYENVLDTTTIEIRNGIKQYNYFSESQANEYIKDITAKTLISAMFDDEYSSVQYNDGTSKWVNTGILSMTNTVTDNNISDVDGYIDLNVSMGSVGYLHTRKPTAESIEETAPSFVTGEQGEIVPKSSFDHSENNFKESEKNYCTGEGDAVTVSFEQGGNVVWNTGVLNVVKGELGIANKTLGYDSITMDGIAVGDTITFDDDDAGIHTITYTYTDPYNYKLDGKGNVTSYSKEYTKSLTVTVSSVAPDAKNAEFAFGSNGSRQTEIDEKTYVMPDVSATSSTIGSKTVGGETIYYPIVEIIMSDGKTSHTSGWYAYFPVLSGVVTITDYPGGTGSAQVYGTSYTSMPTGLSVVGDPTTLFKYQSSSPASAAPTAKSNKLVYSSPKIEAKRSEYNTVIEYSYTDGTGRTYNYFVGYHAPAQSYSSCVTADTLITLSDGSQKRIDELEYTDKLLVWDFYEGKYDIATPAKIDNHGVEYNTKITLDFEDGTVINVINDHYFYDADLNEFVSITEETAQSYIGHNFVQKDGDGYKTVKLVSSNVTTENIESWSVLTAVHYNCIMEDMFSLTASQVEGNLFMPFEVGENMTYDAGKMQADIEEYGVYTYDEFSGYISEDVFNSLNMPYIKVAVGKGIVSYNDVIFLLGYHFEAPEDVSEEAGTTPLNDDEDDVLLTDVVISSKNNITAAVYSVEISCEGATEKEGVYNCISNTAVFTITPNGTKGYVKVTVDGDIYTVPVNSSYTLTVKNAYGKAVTFTTGWGAAESDVENNTIDLGELTINAVKKTDAGVTVTLSNTTKSDITGDIYIAIYDADSRLVMVKRAPDTEIEAKDTKKEISFEVEVGENCTIKAFIWSPSGVTPLAASK